VFHLSFVAFIAGNTIENNQLDPDYYNSALADTDAYNRFYTQVLADPEFESLTADLLGGTNLGDQRSVAVATLRLVLPPDTLREITEKTIAALIAYLRGESARIDTQYDLTQTLANLDGAIGQQAKQLLSTARVEHADTLGVSRPAGAVQHGATKRHHPSHPSGPAGQRIGRRPCRLLARAAGIARQPQGRRSGQSGADSRRYTRRAADPGGRACAAAYVIRRKSHRAASGPEPHLRPTHHP
jgi:hypothetical protein